MDIRRCLFVSLFLLCIASSAVAQIPRFISYQGVVIQGGTALEGSQPVKLTLYRDSLGTNTLFTESTTCTFTKGLFNTQVGPIPAGFDFSQQLYLGIAINGSSDLLPRTAVSAAPYAFYAPEANHAQFADAISGNAGLPSGSIVTFGDSLIHSGFSFTGLSSGQSIGNTWSTSSKLPVPQVYSTSQALNGKIYVLGGENGSQDDNQIYDPATDAWSTGTRLPVGQSQAVSAVVSGKIYVIGGNGGNHNETQIFDPSINQWIQGAPLPVATRRATCQVWQQKIIVFGGMDMQGVPHGNTQIYDPVKDTWGFGAKMMDSVADAASCDGSTRIYLFGGTTLLGSTHNSQLYNPARDDWSRGDYSPGGSTGASCAFIGGQIYLIGGPTNLNQIYDPVAYTWANGAEAPVAPHSATSAVVDGKLYVIGGSTPPQNLNQIYTFPAIRPLYFFTKN